MNFGPDGDLYVLVMYCDSAGCPSGDVWRFDGTTGASKGSFIPPGDRHPVRPFFQVFAPDGDLYVTSNETDEVLRYDGTTGAFIDSFALGGGLDGATGLAVIPRAGIDLLVASRANGRVLRYDGTTGAYVGDFVSAGSGGLESPVGLTFGPDGNALRSQRSQDGRDFAEHECRDSLRRDERGLHRRVHFGLHVRAAHPDRLRTRW